ncbi:hypothetical protein C8A05DRAFT_39185, partial [Staphylotrichum tortipilum]
MALFSRLRTQISSWWQDTPLPAGTSATFQSWHEFDRAGNRWRPVDTNRGSAGTPSGTDPDKPYHLVTWNVDYSSPHPGQRLAAILSYTLSLAPAVDILLLQELSREAFLHLLSSPTVRARWLLSDADGVLPAGQSFTTITLLSRVRFPNPGPVWRVQYPTRFGRDALCCDVFVGRGDVRVRLVNVHLDSLPIQPSLRPGQVAAAAGLLRSAERGVVAGDFNPVLPSDGGLLRENGLVDAWEELKNEEEGFTWGVDGTEPFPPCRMDKVGVVGLRVGGIEVL